MNIFKKIKFLNICGLLTGRTLSQVIIKTGKKGCSWFLTGVGYNKTASIRFAGKPVVLSKQRTKPKPATTIANKHFKELERLKISEQKRRNNYKYILLPEQSLLISCPFQPG
jgi:hypothetical protein